MIGSCGDVSYISTSSYPFEAVLANMVMAEDKNNTKKTIKKDWETGKEDSKHSLFTPEELDIYVNKITIEAYIFHGKDIDYQSLERMEYDPENYSVTVIKKDGTQVDLGVKIQWLIRPHFTRAHEINIVQTKEGKSINGTVIPLIHKTKKKG